MTFKQVMMVLVSISVVSLGACGSGNSPTTSASAPSETAPKPKQSGATQGGQVVEVGSYHLEFLTEKAANGTHLDLYLQRGDTHAAIPNAKVSAQVQTPDGAQQALTFTYDATGEHYTATLPGTTAGQHQVKVTSNIQGETVDGRFSFTQ